MMMTVVEVYYALKYYALLFIRQNFHMLPDVVRIHVRIRLCGFVLPQS